MIGRTSFFTRRAIANFVRSSHGGTPGENLPFSLSNRFRVTALFIVFFGSAFALPFVVVRHQMMKA